MRPQLRTVDERIAQLAARAYGIVTRNELHRAGLSEGQIKGRVRRRALVVMHRGVYRAGPPSALERKFLELLRTEGLPLPIANRPEGGRYVDCRWPEHRLTVELDSYGFHNSRWSWEQDRRRERQAYARGDDFRRYTWGDVFEDPRQMLAELRLLLSPARAGPS